MPLVRLYMRRAGDVNEHDLEIACEEIVPAVYHTDKHPLTPGSIQFVPPVYGCSGLKDDVFIETEGFLYKDRVGLVTGDDAERPRMMKAAFAALFPQLSFAVWPKLVKAGYAADSMDPEFAGDMSMEAAVHRAHIRITALNANDIPA